MTLALIAIPSQYCLNQSNKESGHVTYTYRILLYTASLSSYPTLKLSTLALVECCSIFFVMPIDRDNQAVPVCEVNSELISVVLERISSISQSFRLLGRPGKESVRTLPILILWTSNPNDRFILSSQVTIRVLLIVFIHTIACLLSIRFDKARGYNIFDHVLRIVLIASLFLLSCGAYLLCYALDFVPEISSLDLHCPIPQGYVSPRKTRHS